MLEDFRVSLSSHSSNLRTYPLINTHRVRRREEYYFHMGPDHIPEGTISPLSDTTPTAVVAKIAANNSSVRKMIAIVVVVVGRIDGFEKILMNALMDTRLL